MNRDEKDKIRILFLAADPKDAPRLRLVEEIAKMQTELDRYGRFDLKHIIACPDNLILDLLHANPHYVHYAGHGTIEGLAFEDSNGNTSFISSDDLKKVFKNFERQVKCVVLNACDSEIPAAKIAEHIPFVVGMKQTILDKAALAFSEGFYAALGSECSIERAYELGCAMIERKCPKPEEALTPVLFSRKRGGLKFGSDSDLIDIGELIIRSDECSEEQIKEIVDELRQVLEKRGMRILAIERGSIKLILEGSSSSFKEVEELVKSGELSKQLGVPIEEPQALFSVYQLTSKKAFQNYQEEQQRFYLIGEQYLTRNQYAEAVEVYNQLLTLYQVMSDRVGEATVLNKLGFAHRSLRQYGQAIQSYQQALVLYRTLNDYQRESATLYTPGFAYEAITQYEKGLKPYQQALLLYQELKKHEWETKSAFRLEHVYQIQKDYHQATFFQQVLPSCQNWGDHCYEADLLYSLGFCYESLKQDQDAISHYQQALPLYQALGDRYWEANTLNRLGHAYVSLGQYLEAIEFYQQALLLYRLLNDQTEEAKSLMNLMLVYLVYQILSQAQRVSEEEAFHTAGFDEASSVALTRLALPDYALVMLTSRSASRTAERTVQTANTFRSLRAIPAGIARKERNEQLLQEDRSAQVTGQLVGQEQFVRRQSRLLILDQVTEQPERQLAKQAQFAQAQHLTHAGEQYIARGEYRKAVNTYGQLLRLYQDINFRVGEVAVLDLLGFAHAALGQYEQAIEHYYSALPIHQALNDNPKQAASLYNLGLTYAGLQQYEQAIPFYQQALPLYEALDVQTQDDQTQTANTLYQLGLACYSSSQYRTAVRYFEQALSLYRSLGNLKGEADSLYYAGLCYDLLQWGYDALNYYQQALLLYRELNDRHREAQSMFRLGLAYQSQKDHQRASFHYQQTLPLYRELGDRDQTADALYNLGLCYEALNQHQQAIEVYQEALLLYRRVDDRTGEIRTLMSLISVHEVLGDYQVISELRSQLSAVYGEMSDPTQSDFQP
jgi:tetratricopeptide (TPR) repeat protein